MNQRATLHIAGRVQGVGYRMSAADEATALNLTGYVCNLPNGDVEIIAEGDSASLDKLASWCHQGPPLARVHEVHDTRSPATGEFMAFTIEH